MCLRLDAARRRNQTKIRKKRILIQRVILKITKKEETKTINKQTNRVKHGRKLWHNESWDWVESFPDTETEENHYSNSQQYQQQQYY